MGKYLEKIVTLGAESAKVIDPKSITTAAWVAQKCKYGCSSYGKNLTCPPQSPTYKETAEVIACYDKAILFHSKKCELINIIGLELGRTIFVAGYYKVLTYGYGDCLNCKVYNLAGCNCPEQAIVSLEACGIDVYATVRANGYTIYTMKNNNDETNYYGLISVD